MGATVMGPEALYMWVIYDHPADHPDSYVVRRWRVSSNGPIPDQECRLATSLPEARRYIPNHLAMLERSDGDDPSIVETWV